MKQINLELNLSKSFAEIKSVLEEIEKKPEKAEYIDPCKYFADNVKEKPKQLSLF